MVQVFQCTLLSCSPNFPLASITRYTHAKHGPILNFFLVQKRKRYSQTNLLCIHRIKQGSIRWDGYVVLDNNRAARIIRKLLLKYALRLTLNFNFLKNANFWNFQVVLYIHIDGAYCCSCESKTYGFTDTKIKPDRWNVLFYVKP